jgi:ParB family chromosome partitioning protein
LGGLINMAKKFGGLGRGFDSLIPTDILDEAFDPTAESDEKVSKLSQVKVSKITPNPDQPRKYFDTESLEELAASIKEHGIIQPLVVTPHKDGYIIVAGERRWRAANIAGLVEVPVIIRTLSDQHKLEIALIENLQRRDLNPLETATAYLKLHTQFNLSFQELSKQVGSSQSTISNVMRLLKLPDDAKKSLVSGEISEGHARQILALEGDVVMQTKLLNYIVKENWTVRKTEQFVIGYKNALKNQDNKEVEDKAVKHTSSETPLTKALSERIKLPVSIKTMAKGGRVVIDYKTDDDLERIQSLLG